MARFKCSECRVILEDGEILRAMNPFDQTEEIAGCPKCSAINPFRLVCDEPGCREEVTCGYRPSKDGYRQTCSKHWRAPIMSAPAAPQEKEETL